MKCIPLSPCLAALAMAILFLLSPTRAEAQYRSPGYGYGYRHHHEHYRYDDGPCYDDYVPYCPPPGHVYRYAPRRNRGILDGLFSFFFESPSPDYRSRVPSPRYRYYPDRRTPDRYEDEIGKGADSSSCPLGAKCGRLAGKGCEACRRVESREPDSRSRELKSERWVPDVPEYRNPPRREADPEREVLPGPPNGEIPPTSRFPYVEDPKGSDLPTPPMAPVEPKPEQSEPDPKAAVPGFDDSGKEAHSGERFPLDTAVLTSIGGQTTLREVMKETDAAAVLIDFWASWSGPCVVAMPGLVAREEELAPRGIVVVGMNVEGEPRVADQMKRRQGIDFPWLVEPRSEPFSKQFKIDSIPRVLLIDREGRVQFNGHPDDKDLEKILDELVPAGVENGGGTVAMQ